MRKRLRELRAPVWSTKTHMWRRVLERDLTERGHLEEEALLDRRRDLESAVDPTVPQTLKGLDAPTEAERTAHEITPHQHRGVKLDVGTWHRSTSRQTHIVGTRREVHHCHGFSSEKGPSRSGESMTFW